MGVQREKGWKGGMGGPDFMTVEGPGFSLSGPGVQHAALGYLESLRDFNG